MMKTEEGHTLHAHDMGLAHDLEALSRQLPRRQLLGWLTGLGGAVALGGCGGGGDGGSTSSGGSASTASSTTSTSAASTSTTAAASTTTTSSSTACVADPAETAGPYPADGTNRANGSVVNALTASGIVRSDIRSSFGSSNSMAGGIPLRLTVTVVDTNASCTPLSGYAIYLWHCTVTGKYSLYDLPAENYLRGVQVTDGSGQAVFETIFPGCYSGRYPHIHFEVYASAAAATSGRNAALTSQMCLPRDAATAVYAGNGSLYAGGSANLAAVTIASDNVFGDNTAAQIAAQTPALTGSATAGYAGTITVGLAR